MTGQDQRHLSAIVFTDIVGYSAIVHRDEGLGRRLLDRQREVVRRLIPAHGGREVETAGDSFLLEFGSALAAVEAVIAIQQELARQNETLPDKVALRASVHLGDVEHHGKEVFGDGVNIAARLLPLSPEGGLSLSAPVLAMVRQRLHLPVRSIGTPALKNIETPVEVLVVEAGDLASLAVGAPPASAAPAATAPGPTFRRRWAVPLGLALSVGVLAIGYLTLRSKPVAALDKSVAVLPFANLSDDQANAYFADGMQDEILTNLSRIRDLKVISRTSVERYRGRAHDLRSIAKELDVATVVEGSVQRAGDRVRITVQLIDAATDSHLWAERYDREIADVFAVQSDVAQRIASALRARLLPTEAQAIAAVPTQNARAYDLYLQAQTLSRDFLDDYEWNPDDVPRAVSLLEQAVHEDPEFARGWAELATLEMSVYWLGPTTYQKSERMKRAKDAAGRSLALEPHLGEAHYAMALYHYWGHYDYGSALRELELARAALPGSTKVATVTAAIHRRQGYLEKAVGDFRRAAELDPKRSGSWNELATTLLALGRLDEARASQDRAVAVSDNPELSRVGVASNWASFTGETGPLREAIEALPAGSDERKRIADTEFYLHLLSREYDQAAELLRAMEGDWVESFNFGLPVASFRAWLAHVRGDRETARSASVEARRLLEAAVAEGNTAMLGNLALTYAALGLRDQALEAARRNVSRVEKDAWGGPFAVQNLALVYLLLGDKDQALVRLEEFSEKMRSFCAGCFLDPNWDPLRDDPRFKVVVEQLSRVERDAG